MEYKYIIVQHGGGEHYHVSELKQAWIANQAIDSPATKIYRLLERNEIKALYNQMFHKEQQLNEMKERQLYNKLKAKYER